MLKHTDNIYQGRKSETHEYWHERIEKINFNAFMQHTYEKIPAILGFCSDTGVARNFGRVGSKHGPDAIRKALGSLPYHSRLDKILDMGNIHEDGDLEKYHAELQTVIHQLLFNNYFPIVLGGGHDLAYPHGKAVIDFCRKKNEKVGVINLDAHLDVRPLSNGKRHSGSPFHQLSEEYSTDFHYLCLGMQLGSNPSSLLDFAQKIHTSWIEMEFFHINNWEEIQYQLETFCHDKNKLYLTIDLDGFSSAYAPGVSAPSAFGFDPFLIAKVIRWLLESKKLLSVDIVELNPEYDRDNSTAKLAARLIEYIVRNF